MTRRILTTLSCTLLMVGSDAWCQQWSIELQVGRIRSSLDPAADPASAVAAGIRYDNSTTQLRLVGGVPSSAEQPYWGAFGAAHRLATKRGGFIVGVDLSGHAFLARDRGQRTREVPGLFGPTLEPIPDLSGYAVAGQLLPVFGFEAQRVQLHARVGVSRYDSELGEHQRQRNARLADVQLTLSPAGTVAVVPSVKHVTAGDSSHTHASVTGIVGAGPVVLWANAGQWFDVEQDAAAWGAGASARVLSRLTLNASVRRDSFDPVFLTNPQTSWNVGVQLHIGRNGRPAPVPASYVNGRATIRLSLSQAKTRPSIAGDFNGWKPQPMTKASGAWTYTVAVAPGVYNYAFVDENGAWFVPAQHAGRKEDGMGGYVAVLVVQP